MVTMHTGNVASKSITTSITLLMCFSSYYCFNLKSVLNNMKDIYMAIACILRPAHTFVFAC